jgi:hypothetical protein
MKNPSALQKIIKETINLIFLFSIGLNIWLLATKDDRRIRPREGKDCSIEMKNFINGQWDPVIFVHGYADNYTVAKYIVEIAEKEEAEKGGREPGSFRAVQH